LLGWHTENRESIEWPIGGYILAYIGGYRSRGGDMKISIACIGKQHITNAFLPSVDAVLLQMMPRDSGPNSDDFVMGGP
jgi:hypothetical protein